MANQDNIKIAATLEYGARRDGLGHNSNGTGYQAYGEYITIKGDPRQYIVNSDGVTATSANGKQTIDLSNYDINKSQNYDKNRSQYSSARQMLNNEILVGDSSNETITEGVHEAEPITPTPPKPEIYESTVDSVDTGVSAQNGIYKVQDGENLSTIAAGYGLYGAAVDKLAENNNISNQDLIYTGSELAIYVDDEEVKTQTSNFTTFFEDLSTNYDTFFNAIKSLEEDNNEAFSGAEIQEKIIELQNQIKQYIDIIKTDAENYITWLKSVSDKSETYIDTSTGNIEATEISTITEIEL